MKLPTHPLVLTPDQAMIADAARELAEREAPIARFRKLRDAGLVVDAELWSKVVELGWPALTVPEADGGLGLGLTELCVGLEALGRNLAATPLVSAAMAAPLAPAEVVAGVVVALAWQERGARQDPSRVAARVEGGRLWAEKVAVLDASAAAVFVVSAREGDRLGLYRVEVSHADVRPLRRVDSRDCADVSFDAAPATPVEGDLEASLDLGRIALSAEMLGGLQAVFDRTLAWLKERVQFGVPIGSFQALQHRAVDLFVEIELARSAVMAASRAPSPLLASLAKARVSDAFLRVAKEAVQIHGGIGMTDEHDVGLYLKRAQVAAVTLGDGVYHRDRWATLQGW